MIKNIYKELNILGHNYPSFIAVFTREVYNFIMNLSPSTSIFCVCLRVVFHCKTISNSCASKIAMEMGEVGFLPNSEIIQTKQTGIILLVESFFFHISHLCMEFVLLCIGCEQFARVRVLCSNDRK